MDDGDDKLHLLVKNKNIGHGKIIGTGECSLAGARKAAGMGSSGTMALKVPIFPERRSLRSKEAPGRRSSSSSSSNNSRDSSRSL